MKNILIITLALLLVGCGSSDKTEVTPKKVDTTNQQLEMQQASSLLITHFMKSLKSELMKGVKEGGFENAISACQTKAPEIASKFSTENWSIKRVTNKPRNQLNIADAHQQEILALFADSLKKFELFEEWQDVENKKDYYFYKPIYMGKFCLKCHGDSQTIDEKAAAALEEKYQDDKAVDYNEGDLRGMFVVQIESAEILPLLIQALRDSL